MSRAARELAAMRAFARRMKLAKAICDDKRIAKRISLGFALMREAKRRRDAAMMEG
jgi:hypothetical protein